MRPGPVIGPEMVGTGGVAADASSAAAIAKTRIRVRIVINLSGRARTKRSIQEELMNRYLHAVLTIIAVELGWIALNHSGVPVSAQQKATPVIITGVELPRDYSFPVALRNVDLRDNAFVPVGILGQPLGSD